MVLAFVIISSRLYGFDSIGPFSRRHDLNRHFGDNNLRSQVIIGAELVTFGVKWSRFGRRNFWLRKFLKRFLFGKCRFFRDFGQIAKSVLTRSEKFWPRIQNQCKPNKTMLAKHYQKPVLAKTCQLGSS